MEKMLNEYSIYKFIILEKDENFNMSDLIVQIVEKYDNKNISMSIAPRIYINGRKNLIRRCINNLIDNAIKYGDKVIVEL